MLKVLQIIIAEFRRLLSTRMSRIALLALAVVPLLYGGVYLWANQDPYARLSNIPVALVVVDEGGEDINGNYQNIGHQVADKLVKEKIFDWHLVGINSAESGVTDGKYDFSVTLPKEFTKKIISNSHPNPEPALVLITTNDANSYLATTIGSHAAEQIKAAITKLVNENAANRIITAISDLRTGFVKAHDGATAIAHGTTQANSGGKQISDGIAQIHSATELLPDKSAQLAQGAGKVAQGANQIADGAGRLEAGAVQIKTGTDQLTNGIHKIAAGAQQVAAGNEKIALLGKSANEIAQDGKAIIPKIRAQIVQDLTAKGFTSAQIDEVLKMLDPVGDKLADNADKITQVNTQIQALAQGAKKVANGAEQLAGGTDRLQNGVEKIATGAQNINNGANQIAEGNKQLADGANRIAQAAPQLAGAIAQAYSGSKDLALGINKINFGAKEINQKIGEAITRIPNTTESERISQAKGIAKPVDLTSHTLATAGSYGAGLAPFFLSLASWIGMYALMIIMKPVSKRAITALRSPIRVGIAGWLTPSFMGVVQATALYAVVSLAIHFQIQNPLKTLLFMMLTCVTYAAIIVALNVWLGSVGQFIGLVLMVLQLVTAGGTFPWQTLPSPIAVLHHWLPMSYSVDGIRQLMYGGSMNAAYHDTWFIAVVLGMSLLIIVIGVARQSDHRTIRDLQPSIIG